MIQMTENTLKSLLEKELFELKSKKNVVRVCGPLTSGGFGYEINAERLSQATKKLISKGYSVWNYETSEKYIKPLNLKWETIMEDFHIPILRSGFIKKAFFIQNWESSNGAKVEYNQCRLLGIECELFPEEWFN